MILLGVSGYARAGKDTFAEALAPLGYERLAFADILREFLYRLDPTVTVGEDSLITVSQIINAYGWNGYKNSQYASDIRTLLQRLGTECGRELLGDNIWVDSTLKDLLPNGKYVVTDCRFPNEADAIRERDGRLIRVTREGIGPANSHPSETSLDNYPFDYFLRNNGTKEEFYEKVRRTFS